MKFQLIALFLVFVLAAKAQPLEELDAAGYERLATTGLAFVNFNVPDCDLARNYNNNIEMLNAQLSGIPIYHFNSEKYPKVKKKYKLWKARRLAMVVDGKFVSHYEGIYGLNLMRNWIVREWNKHKGTNFATENARFSPNLSSIDVNFAAALAFDFGFDGNGNDKVSNAEKFSVSNINSAVRNNCLYSKGVYKSRNVQYFTGWKTGVSSHNFTLAFEFMPSVTTYNTVLVGSRYSRHFGIEVQNDMLVFSFQNGNYRYVCTETKIEANQWNLLAVSYDHSGRELHVILNGQALQGIHVDANAKIEDENTSFGICNYGSGEVYKGYMNNLKIYNKSFKNGDLQRLYQNQKRDFPSMSRFTSQIKLCNYSFETTDKTTADFVSTGTAAKIENGMLSLFPEKKGSYDKVQTPIFGELDPRNFAFSLSFRPKRYGKHGFQYFVGLHGRGVRYVNIRTKKSELALQLELKKGQLELLTKGANLEPGKWNNVAVSYSQQDRRLLLSVDEVVLIDKILDESTPFQKAGGEAFVSFTGFGNPYTFSGDVDNVVLYKRALSRDEMTSLP